MLHLDNLENILQYILEETPADKMINILYERLTHMCERQLVLEDTENFIAYSRYFISIIDKSAEYKFKPKILEEFIERTYVGFGNQQLRLQLLQISLKEFFEKHILINNQTLQALEDKVESEKAPTLYRIMERARIAVILKWMQGPLQNRLSAQFRDYVLFLATAYGQYKAQRISAIDWQKPHIPDEDLKLIIQEYAIFERALREAIQTIRENKNWESLDSKYPPPYHLIFESLENLIKSTKEETENPMELFKDKIIVATALIYFQDDFVKKDTKLQHIISLFVSLYYQFRDQRDIKVTTPGSCAINISI